MSVEIHKASERKGLTPRREPYWGAPLGRGLRVGFRKISARDGTWIARKQVGDEKLYKSLGAESTEHHYEWARQQAGAWFRALDAEVESGESSVTAACRDYVTDRRAEKGEACAHDAEKRFERTVYGRPFGNIALAKLRTARVKEWRDGLGLSKGASNRTLTALKAALNLAVANRKVHPAAAREWKDVKPYANATQRRTLFLDRDQRLRLIEATSGGLRDLMQAAALTGARAGELTSLTCGQFDARLGIVKFKGKTGPRTVPVSPPARDLFTRLAKGRAPGAVLLTRDDGKPWSHSDWDELVRAAADQAKLPKGVCLYTLRHSFITAAISGGMSTLDVARICGTSVTMIEKHYGHLVADAARERLAAVTML